MRKQLLVNVPLALHAKLKHRARVQGRTMTDIVVGALQTELDEPIPTTYQDEMVKELDEILKNS